MTETKQLSVAFLNIDGKYFSKSRVLFVCENYIFQREPFWWDIPDLIPACFDFFPPSSSSCAMPVVRLPNWDEGCWALPVLLEKSFPKDGGTFAQLQCSRISVPEFSILFLYKKTNPGVPEAHSQPAWTRGFWGWLPSYASQELAPLIATFLHVSEAQLLLDTSLYHLWVRHGLYSICQ